MTDVADGSFDEQQVAASFIDFSKLVHDGRRPYDWQVRLSVAVARDGVWPSTIEAPTGAGKTCVVDVHLFVQALAGLGAASTSAPRRLALIVNRRALVDSQFQYALDLCKRLGELAGSGDTEAPRWITGLNRRSGLEAAGAPGGSGMNALSAVQVVNLRGGQASRDPWMQQWRVHPELVSVLCFTPEMFGSRLLFRGYGVAPGARPIEAALLAYDTVAVIDEAHLSRQLAVTARQVPRIEQLGAQGISVPALQTVVSTATPAADDAAPGKSINVLESDIEHDQILRRRLCTPKPVELASIGDDPGKAERIAQLAVEMRRRQGGTVGVVVNTVSMAITIGALLRGAGAGEVVTLVGRMRGFDRESIMSRHPGLFTARGCEDVSFVVGTQTLEVGLDMDFSGLVTELASGSALAQRAGRVNRFGARDSGPIIVCVPDLKVDKRSGIYTPEELADAAEWLSELPDEGLTPWIVSRGSHIPPPTRTQRFILQRIESWDVDTLASTSESLASEAPIAAMKPTGVDLWIKDDIERDNTISVAVRGYLPRSDALAARVLELTPVLEEETIQVPISLAYRLWKRPEDSDGANIRRDLGERLFLDPTTEDRPVVVEESTRPRPGDTILVEEGTAAFTEKVFEPSGTDTIPDVLEAVVSRRNELLWQKARTLGKDRPAEEMWVVRVYVPPVDLRAEFEPVIQGIDRDDWVTLANSLRLLQQVDTGDVSGPDGVSPLDVFGDWLNELGPASAMTSDNGSLARLRSLVGTHHLLEVVHSGNARIDFVGTDDLDDEFAVVFTSQTVLADAIDFETSTPGRDFVLLDDHQQRVGERAASIAEKVGVPSFIQAVRRAGQLHDEGKRDPRFQGLLRLGDRGAWRIGSADLAKSRFRSRTRERAYRSAKGISGWRHEQRSAVVAWEALGRQGNDDRELITRLVGTTHGRGRATFQHTSEELLPKSSGGGSLVHGAEELFDRGVWESLVDSTAARYGQWGVAFLEALLRAGDVQVSGEGH